MRVEEVGRVVPAGADDGFVWRFGVVVVVMIVVVVVVIMIVMMGVCGSGGRRGRGRRVAFQHCRSFGNGVGEEFQLAGDEGCVLRVAGPGGNIDYIQSGVE